mmetsp:Transcript_65443/g.95871  ORF Transcript_65443/g.95871 Transcript_65443/m.95871 type:complete len:221 (+) Transcript_65443:530-1192(+)
MVHSLGVRSDILLQLHHTRLKLLFGGTLGILELVDKLLHLVRICQQPLVLQVLGSGVLIHNLGGSLRSGIGFRDLGHRLLVHGVDVLVHVVCHLECLLDDTCFLLRIGLGRVIRLLGVRLMERGIRLGSGLFISRRVSVHSHFVRHRQRLLFNLGLLTLDLCSCRILLGLSRMINLFRSQFRGSFVRRGLFCICLLCRRRVLCGVRRRGLGSDLVLGDSL